MVGTAICPPRRASKLNAIAGQKKKQNLSKHARGIKHHHSRAPMVLAFEPRNSKPGSQTLIIPR